MENFATLTVGECMSLRTTLSSFIFAANLFLAALPH